MFTPYKRLKLEDNDQIDHTEANEKLDLSTQGSPCLKQSIRV